ncbi:MAG: flotillin-like FloA family protein [Victivallales bacterium]|nr:flotillin-like FloA family protein [Victivallales bacterium]
MFFPLFLYGVVGFALVGCVLVLGWAIIKACQFFPLWVEAKAAGIPFSFGTMFRLHFQKLEAKDIFECLKVLKKAGIQVSTEELIDHKLAGGSITTVREAAVACDKAGVRMGFPAIAALDLAGRNIAKAVREHVNPVVIPCPPRQKGYENGLVGVAKDGISLAVKCRISVRTNLERLIGMAGAETIVARVGQGIVTAIGNAASHREIVEHPSIISDQILARGLDEGTCYEILSLDIEDVTILDNVAARLAREQAEAAKLIAQAQAEERRSLAVAAGQEMVAKTTEMNAQLTGAKSAIPHAVASAFQHPGALRSPRLKPLVGDQNKWCAPG